MATRNGHLEATRVLVHHDAKETFDFFGESPRYNALEQGYENIVEFLAGVFGPEDCQGLRSAPRTDVLSEVMEEAIHADDLEECKRLVSCGCPIDIELSDGDTAFLFSLFEGRLEIAAWLMSHGANVQRAARLNNGKWTTAVELAGLEESLTSILPQLFNEYLRQGGDLVHGDDYPLHKAAKVGNVKGLRTLLECIEDHIGTIA
ncbi:hypothetical protein QQZ08_003619 [Neonectria magnoliae]|uniref:Ankyrin repeat protein n=1 Tax=Neonectria magnoliae TaxID=2732573 RepID=A0ABR1I854_9HYPO